MASQAAEQPRQWAKGKGQANVPLVFLYVEALARVVERRVEKARRISLILNDRTPRPSKAAYDDHEVGVAKGRRKHARTSEGC